MRALLAILSATVLFCSCQQPYKGYHETYNKDGMILLVKDQEKGANLSPKTDSAFLPIPEKTAVCLIKNHIDNISANGELNPNETAFVQFSASELFRNFFSRPANDRFAPDSLRIYFARYPEAGSSCPDLSVPDRPGRQTVVVVGVKNGKDIVSFQNANTRPVNIGSLCPPGCVVDEVPLSGASYLKAAMGKINIEDANQ